MGCLLISPQGVEAKFGTTIDKMVWLPRSVWSLTGLDGQDLGNFDGLVASDKNVASPRFKEVTGRPPPLGLLLYCYFSLMRVELGIYSKSCFSLRLASLIYYIY